MPRTNAEKLLIRAGTEVLVRSTTLEQRALVEPLPEGAVVVGPGRDTAEVVILFAHDAAELEVLLREVLPALGEPRAAWICYPRGGRSDINRDIIWNRVQEVGWRLNANIALSDVWSSVRLKRVA